MTDNFAWCDVKDEKIAVKRMAGNNRYLIMILLKNI